jgi:membrane fusion protein, multidrug efflux system
MAKPESPDNTLTTGRLPGYGASRCGFLELPFIALTLIWLAACSKPTSKDPQSAQARVAPTKVPVGVVLPQRKDLTRTIALLGTLVAFNEATLYGKVAGYLKSISVDKGDRVHRGQSLAMLEVPEMVKEIDQAQAAYQEALANLNQAKAEADLEGVTYKRYSEVHSKDPDAIANQELDQYRSKYEVAEANVKLAEARVAMAAANRDRLVALHRYANITAPFSGVVTARFVDPGALIQAATSSTQGQAIITVQDLDTIRVYVSVPEVNVPLIHIGTPASLTTAPYPGKVFTAAVTRFAEALDPSTRTMKTEIDVPNRGHLLRPGMYADVTLVSEVVRNALVVQDSALVVESSRIFVWVVRGGAAHRVEVETGMDDGAEVVIRSGLSGEEQVVVAGKDSLDEGKGVESSPLKAGKL